MTYLIITAPLAIAYHFGPDFFNVGPVMNLIGASAITAILIGQRMHRSDAPAAWRLIALGQALFVAGDVITYNYERFFHTELPYPSIGDVFYLAVYPSLVAGLAILVRKRTPGGDRTAVIDSLIVAVGLGALSWKLLIAPHAHDHSLSLLTKLTSMAYPVMDVVVLSVIVRLAVGGGRRDRAFYLIVTAVGALLATDAVFGWKLLHGGYEPGAMLDAGWMVFYVLLGSAALHPSMRTLAEPAPPSLDDNRRTLRLAMLGIAAIAAPATQAVLLAVTPAQATLPYIISSGILFMLVAARMAGLVRRTEQAASREQALREASARLVAATSAQEIYEAAVVAAEGVGDSPDAFVFLGVDYKPASASTTIVATTFPYPVGHLPDWVADSLARMEGAELAPGERHDARWLFVTPMFTKGATTGLIGMSTRERPTKAAKDGLSIIAAQVALALESAALTENLVRRQSEARFRSLVQNSSDVVAVVDAGTTIRYVSPSVERVLGHAPGRLEGTRFIDLVSVESHMAFVSFLRRVADSTDAFECRMRRSDGSWGHVEIVRTNLLDDPNVAGIVLNTRDVGDRKAFEEQLRRQAFSDSVTGLANRALLRNRIEHALERQNRSQLPVAVLFVDLDDFKTVNDSLGHAAGDRLLVDVGERIVGCLRASDTAARLGGDEFAVLLEDHEGEVFVGEVATRILEVVSRPFVVDGKQVFVSASIGIAFAEPSGREGDPDILLRNADVAMYTAKQSGKGRYQLFEPAMQDAVMQRLELKADLLRAVDDDEFELFYQPLVRLETREIYGLEALIRWRHPRHGMRPPSEFIPLAEETGLIVPIGAWVMREACRQTARLAAIVPGASDLRISMNVSARQLQSTGFVAGVREALEESGLDPSQVVLEITESAMMEDVNLAIVRLGDVKALGVRVAVDDFGTGYSSLNYIRQLPVDILKIDKSFVDGVPVDSEMAACTRTIVDLARALGLETVAEGIEDDTQATAMIEMGCRLGQGYLFAKPMSVEAIEAVLRIHNSRTLQAVNDVA